MPAKNIKSFFAIHEVVVLTGFSKYMLDYLAREDIFCPSGLTQAGRGRRRRYSYEDVILLRALHTICAGKGKIRHLKDSLVEFRRTFGRIAPGERIERLLVVQGDKLCTFDGGERLRELVSGQLCLSFVFDLFVVSQAIANCVTVDVTSNKVKLNRATARMAEAERQRIFAPMKARREAAR